MSRHADRDRGTRKFRVRYYHDWRWWHIVVDAYDADDALERLARMGLQTKGREAFALPMERGLARRALDAFKGLVERIKKGGAA